MFLHFRPGRRRVARTDAVDPPRTPDSMDVGDALTILENGQTPYKSNAKEDPTTSPHSYLSMPSCKQFPRIRSVEPLSRVLEPVVVMIFSFKVYNSIFVILCNIYNTKLLTLKLENMLIQVFLLSF